ncbi:MAG: hypothetical protein ACTTKL_11010 [Treponema sp.]
MAAIFAGGCGRKERYLNDAMQPRPFEILLAQNSLLPSFAARPAFAAQNRLRCFVSALVSCPFGLFRFI